MATPTKPVLLSTDTFNRTNSSTTMGSTDGAGADGTGLLDPIAWVPQGVSVWGISSNQATLVTPDSGGDSFVEIPTSYHNVDISVTVNTSGGQAGLIIRLGSGGASAIEYYNSLNDTVAVEAHTNTKILDVAGAASGDVLRLVAVGASLTFYRNGSQIGTASFDTGIGTNHGLFGNNSFATALLDNFSLAGIEGDTLTFTESQQVGTKSADTGTFTESQHIGTSDTDTLTFTESQSIGTQSTDSLTFTESQTISVSGPGANDNRNPGVMTASTIQIQTVNPIVINPIGSFDLNIAVQIPTPTFVERVLTVSTNTSISVPTRATFVSIQPPAANANTLTFKGASGDTGVIIHPTLSSTFCLDPAQTSFVLNASSATSVTFTFI